MKATVTIKIEVKGVELELTPHEAGDLLEALAGLDRYLKRSENNTYIHSRNGLFQEQFHDAMRK